MPLLVLLLVLVVAWWISPLAFVGVVLLLLLGGVFVALEELELWIRRRLTR